MPTRSTAFAFTFALVACSSPTDTPQPARGPDSRGRLAGATIESSRAGAWESRRVAGAAGGTASTEVAKEGLVLHAVDAPGEAFRSSSIPGRDTGLPAQPAANQSPLRAGSTDDNADLGAFLAYLDARRREEHLRDAWRDLDVRDRHVLRVTDHGGRALPGLRVRVVDEAQDRVVLEGTTYGDGCCHVYPRQSGAGPASSWLVEVEHDGKVQRTRWPGTATEATFAVERSATPPSSPLALDVVFLIDTTGSMGDEIDRIKSTLLAVTARLRGLANEFSLRYGAVLYRDVGDEYLTQRHAFTADIAAFDAALQGVVAGGGGDGPESLNQGLAVAVGEMDWRLGAARVAFLVADAPPHLDYEGDIDYATTLRRAAAEGIRIHAVAASGLDDAGSLVFRQIAQFTHGEFVFIEYGGDLEASAAQHGVSSVSGANNLDEILFARLQHELTLWSGASGATR